MTDQRLDGWKAIANFLGRERSTAIRWANERGLPVHRVPGGRTGSIYAIRSELEAWLAGDRDGQRPPDKPVGEVARPAPRRGGAPGWRAPAALAAAAILLALALFIATRPSRPADAPVSLGAVASSSASPVALDFARGLNADLARFANASPDLAIFEREPGAAPATEYAVRTEIERIDGRLVAKARLVAVRQGRVVWSRRFDQSGPSLSALREQVAANIVGLLRCGLAGLDAERPKAGPADLEQVMAICQSIKDDDLAAARARARRFTVRRPDLALGWAMLAAIEGTMVSEGDLAGDAALLRQAVAHSRRAAAIAPDHLVTLLAQAAVSGDGPTGPRALPVVDRALRLRPDEPILLSQRSVILFNLGYVRASVADALSAVRNDPSSFGARDVAVRRLAAADRLGEALRLQAKNEQLWPDHPQVAVNRARIVADRAANRAEIARLERNLAAEPSSAYRLAQLHERLGDRPAALAWLARAPVGNALQQWSLLFWPDAAGLRTEPAFFRKMAELGLVRWWLARGAWPDFCAEPGLRYSCAGEARKLAPPR